MLKKNYVEKKEGIVLSEMKMKWMQECPIFFIFSG